MRLFTRRGYDWSHRFPWIVRAALGLRARSFAIDGEAVVCGEDGVSDFDKLHSQGWGHQVCLYAFDLLEVYGVDFRDQPLEKRKVRLARLLQGADPGLRYNEHLTGDGASAFEHVCKLGLEGIVSKRRDFPYRSGRTKSWLKVKNPMSPAMLRVQDGTW